jgi:hypothetical protein
LVASSPVGLLSVRAGVSTGLAPICVFPKARGAWLRVPLGPPSWAGPLLWRFPCFVFWWSTPEFRLPAPSPLDSPRSIPCVDSFCGSSCDGSVPPPRSLSALLCFGFCVSPLSVLLPEFVFGGLVLVSGFVCGVFVFLCVCRCSDSTPWSSVCRSCCVLIARCADKFVLSQSPSFTTVPAFVLWFPSVPHGSASSVGRGVGARRVTCGLPRFLAGLAGILWRGILRG